MAASQIGNPQFKKQILQSIGMQQAILLEGDSKNLDKSQEYQDKVKEIKPMIYAQILQDTISAGGINDATIKAKYEQMKQKALHQKQYSASHILVKDEKLAKEIIEKLKKGTKFTDLAKKYSIDPGSKVKGGDLGWSDGSNYVPEFTKALESLQKGNFSTTPVKSQFGYHIIKLNDMKIGNQNSVPAFDKIKEQLKQEIQMEKTKEFFENLKAKYKVEVK